MSLQMTCPYCKREFPYDNGKLDREISDIGQRINAIDRDLATIKASSPRARRAAEGRRKVLTLEVTGLRERLSGLKAVRKAADQQIKAFEYQTFKDIVKDRYGDAEYKKILAMVQEELKAYKASSLMRHEYTRSNAKANVTSINKL